MDAERLFNFVDSVDRDAMTAHQMLDKFLAFYSSSAAKPLSLKGQLFED